MTHHPITVAKVWRTGPKPLRWLVWCGVVAIIALLALPVIMTINREAVEATIMNNNPDLDPDLLEGVWIGTLVYSYGLHAATGAIFVWLGWKVLKRRNWARIALSAFLVFATGASMISAMAGSMYLWAVIVGDGTHIVGLLLLWCPPSVRAYFRSPAPVGDVRATTSI